EDFLEYTGLRVRAVQDRDVAPAATVVDPVANAVRDEFSLIALVESGIEPDRVPAVPAGPQVLAQPAGVVRDQAIGGSRDRRRRAIILLEPVQLGVRVIAPELVQILHPRASPPVNGLIVVPDDER